MSPLDLILGASAGLLLTAGVAWTLRGRGAMCQAVAAAGTFAASMVGLVGSLWVLLAGVHTNLLLPWSMTGGSLHLGVDALSALFLVPIFFIGGLAAIYGRGYLAASQQKRRIGRTWFFYNLLMVGMIGVALARDGLVFLLAWEVMAMSPTFLVTFDHEQAAPRQAAWIYMVASHLGLACLMALFLLLSGGQASLDFDSYAASASSLQVPAGLLFVLAVVGFGSKAGFLPLHVWLPEAHPAAPSHVSALMSGVMIKLGIYGLVRVLSLLGPPPELWGWVLVGVGVSSGVLGVVFALAQHDLKRLLAYHSVENIGIIAIGLGLGTVGWARGDLSMTALGFGGGLLHVLNHSIFKSLLFLGAGSVQHGTGALSIERLGGLAHRMPTTAATFLVGAAAIVGLPPLNGFISEFLLLVASLQGAQGATASLVVGSLVSLGALGLISGLAAACFVKAYGIVFLGTPRSAQAAEAHEADASMRGPMVVLALSCVGIGLGGSLIIPFLAQPVADLTGLSRGELSLPLVAVSQDLLHATGVLLVFLVVVGVLFGLRAALRKRQPDVSAETWGCGYTSSSPRVQYTASSFAHPITRVMQPVLQTTEPTLKVDGLYPEPQTFHSHAPDVFYARLFTPIFAWLARTALRARKLQSGNVHLYVLYLALTLIALLVGVL